MIMAVVLNILTQPLMAGVSDIVRDKCASCHGEDGNSKYPRVPNIAGFSEELLEHILTDFKEHKRPAERFKPDKGEATDMNTIAGDLSDADIEALAKYYSAQPYRLHKEPVNAKLAKRGARLHRRRCEKCHSDGGTNPDDDAALLAGQPREYLTRTFEKLSGKKRHMPRKMKKKFNKLSEKQKQELIEFYVSGGNFRMDKD